MTVYALKNYNETLRCQHSILKDQKKILKTFKNKVKEMISQNIEIEM